MMGNLDFVNAVTEISLAAEYLKATGAPKVGIAGFCMGGALTMGALAASDDITCGAPFYGVNCKLQRRMHALSLSSTSPHHPASQA